MTDSNSPAPRSSASAEAQFRIIIDTAMDGIVSMNKEQKIVLFNIAAEQIFGYRAEQVLGQSIDMLIPPRFHVQHQQDVQQFGLGVVQHRRMGTQRTVMALRSSGEEFPIEASISQANSDGEKIFTAIVRDVTEAVRHRRQIERQSQMLDQVSDAVNVVDRKGRITYWNQAASRMYGWAAGEVLGRQAVDVLFLGNGDILKPILQEANEQGSWSGELTKATRTGSTIIVDHRRTVLHDETGAIDGYLCIDIDITARKKRERVAYRSQRLESIGTLAGGIAHDLNNVLTPIMMGTQLLASGRAPADSRGLMATMEASAQRGADLVKQLLSFAGGIRGDRAPVQLDKLISETRGLLEHTLPKSIQIKTEMKLHCPSVMADSTELSQILMNLGINARDAMPDGGKLTIEAAETVLNGNSVQLHPDAHPGRYVVLKVTDTGTGMRHDVLDRIFDPFFTTKEVGKGTGLGLATVQGIVKSHGGFITVYSEVGRGSSFSIYLPAIESTEPVSAKAIQKPTESGVGRTVLLVDDEAFILQITSTALEGSGYTVLTAADGEEAVSIFSQRHDEISAVLLDMMMPGLDGFETLERLRKIDPDVSVIACSGLRTSQREAEALERGARAFLAKPYSEEDLLATLAKTQRSGKYSN